VATPQGKGWRCLACTPLGGDPNWNGTATPPKPLPCCPGLEPKTDPTTQWQHCEPIQDAPICINPPVDPCSQEGQSMCSDSCMLSSDKDGLARWECSLACYSRCSPITSVVEPFARPIDNFVRPGVYTPSKNKVILPFKYVSPALPSPPPDQWQVHVKCLRGVWDPQTFTELRMDRWFLQGRVMATDVLKCGMRIFAPAPPSAAPSAPPSDACKYDEFPFLLEATMGRMWRLAIGGEKVCSNTCAQCAPSRKAGWSGTAWDPGIMSEGDQYCKKDALGNPAPAKLTWTNG